MTTNRTVGIIIPAAGSGLRFGGIRPKQFLPLRGLPVYLHSVRFFCKRPETLQVVVVMPPTDVKLVWQNAKRLGVEVKRVLWVPGGASRHDSVENGLKNLSTDCEWVAVHDAVRPLIDHRLYDSILQAAKKTGAAIPGLPVVDTLKRQGPSSHVLETISRNDLISVQTPQVFKRGILEDAYRKAGRQAFTGTDEASLVERLGIPVTVVPGSRRNIKITVSSDLILAEWLWNHRQWK